MPSGKPIETVQEETVAPRLYGIVAEQLEVARASISRRMNCHTPEWEAVNALYEAVDALAAIVTHSRSI